VPTKARVASDCLPLVISPKDRTLRMADPVQMRAKEKRLADALRANLKRRKAQSRERAAHDQSPAADTEKPDDKTAK
jgi:hypothetical protein